VDRTGAFAALGDALSWIVESDAETDRAIAARDILVLLSVPESVRLVLDRARRVPRDIPSIAGLARPENVPLLLEFLAVDSGWPFVDEVLRALARSGPAGCDSLAGILDRSVRLAPGVEWAAQRIAARELSAGACRVGHFEALSRYAEPGSELLKEIEIGLSNREYGAEAAQACIDWLAAAARSSLERALVPALRRFLAQGGRADLGALKAARPDLVDAIGGGEGR
jgi:hypothetical protein